MNLPAPVIDNRDQAARLDSLLRQLPGYVPGWQPASSSSAVALMRIAARYAEILAAGVNQVPDRSLLAFLDMLGIQLLPAKAARVPLVFSLLANAPIDVTLQRGGRVAAPARLNPPSAAAPDQEPTSVPEVAFATRQTITVCRSQLAALYSIDPRSDEFADHTSLLPGGFTLFDDLQPTQHALYLGHDDYFALGGENIKVMLSFSLDSGATQALSTQWEYLTEGGWSPLQSTGEDDTTNGLQADGVIQLNRAFGPKAKQDTFDGHTSYWLRGHLTTPVLPDGQQGQRTIPVINDIQARVGFACSNIAPEAAFADGVPLDVSKDFYPFGKNPATYTTFYLACKEVFQRKGATVTMEVDLRQNGRAPAGKKLTVDKKLTVEWEYFNGTVWHGLGVLPANYDFTHPDTSSGVASKTLSFDCLPDWAETTVNGTKNFWLRARITQGSYGQPPTMAISDVAAHVAPSSTTTVPDPVKPIGGATNVAPSSITITPDTLKPPVIKSVAFSFTYLTDPFTLDHCLSVNDFVFEDHTEDARWPNRTFKPFRPVEDSHPAVHFGFDERLPTGLVSTYVDIPEVVEEGNVEPSPFVWEYRSGDGWTELGVLDETDGFRHSGMIQFVGPPDAIAVQGLGGELYWVRAHFKQGEQPGPLPVSGLWLNAAWAERQDPPEQEGLGTSDGNPGQTFSFTRSPVLEGETIEVQEWQGRGEDWQTSVQGVPESNLRFETDPVTRETLAVWVTWQPQSHLHDSGPDDRHYCLERANGLIRFGNGQHGLIPPAGSRISALYSSGGGAAGNVAANAITELRTAVPFIQSVTNPVPASGGANIESVEAVKQRGPQLLRHRGRAVAAADCEWLARTASSDVARVCCLPITGSAGRAQRGSITLLVAPASPDPEPEPSPELSRRIREYVASYVPATASQRVRVTGPQYVEVDVYAEIIPSDASSAARVEAQVRDSLNQFLHPLTGGMDGQGWAFGQPVYLSQIAAIIEATSGVDYARAIRLRVGDQNFADTVPVDAYSLVAAGAHELKLSIGAD